jgi:hypothetical protein
VPTEKEISQEAAREMLAALHKLVIYWDNRHPKDYAQARAAILKAEEGGTDVVRG